MANRSFLNSSLSTGTKKFNLISTAPITTSGDFYSISTTPVSGGTTYDLTSIPNTYKHLQVRINCAVGSPDQYMYFNGDTTNANYVRLDMATTGTGTAPGSGTAALPYTDDGGTGSGSPYAYSAIIDIFHYSDATRYKTSKSWFGYSYNGSGRCGTNIITWNTKASVSSIRFAGRAMTNGTIALYGIK
jgi:hypothetical protein